MKKVFVFAIVFCIIMCPVFAKGHIGATISPNWTWIGKIMDEKAPANTGSTGLTLALDGGHYFGQNGGFGIEYGLGMNIPLKVWTEGVSQNVEDGSSAFVFKSGAAYRYEFSDLLGLSAGLGLGGEYSRESTYADGIKMNASIFSLNMYGKVSADVTVINALRISAGVTLSGPLYTNMKVSAQGESISKNLKASAFTLAPFVGVAYAY